jgi:hypothetical protein
VDNHPAQSGSSNFNHVHGGLNEGFALDLTTKNNSPFEDTLVG